MRELNDRYQNPMAGGYRDIQLVVQFQNHMCELQLNTEEMLRAKSTTGHRGFEVLRELAAATKENDLDRVKGALQFGLEHLGSRWGDASSSKTALEELLQLEESREIVVEACRRGSAGIVAQLLFSGADANAVSPASGDTALHEAVFHGHQGCVWAVSRASLGRHSFDIELLPGLSLGLAARDGTHSAYPTLPGLILAWLYELTLCTSRLLMR